MKTWAEGWLPDGTHFHFDGDPYGGGGVLRIDGQIVEPLPGRMAVERWRDGGTTSYKTKLGTFVAYRKIGDEHYNSWNRKHLLSEPPDSANPQARGNDDG